MTSQGGEDHRLWEANSIGAALKRAHQCHDIAELSPDPRNGTVKVCEKKWKKKKASPRNPQSHKGEALGRPIGELTCRLSKNARPKKAPNLGGGLRIFISGVEPDRRHLMEVQRSRGILNEGDR